MKTSKIRICITLLLAKAHRGEKTHSVEEVQRGVMANSQDNSTIPIYRYYVANLSLETPIILNRHHIRIMSKHTIDSLPASYMIRHDAILSSHQGRTIQ